MPRLPVDGNKVVEHRITLGTFERQQVERFIDGMQVKNIGTGIGAATDPIEAVFSTTLGTIGGVFFVAWALKRFFDIDVPIPTDLEDVTEGWNAILTAIQLDKDGREKLAKYIEELDLKEKSTLLGPILSAFVPGFAASTFGVRALKGAADFIFTPLENPRYTPESPSVSQDLFDQGFGDEVDDVIDVQTTWYSEFNLSPTQAECMLGKIAEYEQGLPPYTGNEQSRLFALTMALRTQCLLNPGVAGAIVQKYKQMMG